MSSVGRLSGPVPNSFTGSGTDEGASAGADADDDDDDDTSYSTTSDMTEASLSKVYVQATVVDQI
jgi:hypothetical protein